MILIDTDVLSLTRRPDRSPRAASWFEVQDPGNLYLSAVTVGEVEKGIALQVNRNPGFAVDLRDWLRQAEALFEDRILPFDVEAARHWGRLVAQVGHATPDTMIAAIAVSHGAVVATMNSRHFSRLGVRVVDPFA
jgi:toxin FitB